MVSDLELQLFNTMEYCDTCMEVTWVESGQFGVFYDWSSLVKLWQNPAIDIESNHMAETTIRTQFTHSTVQWSVQ